MWITSNEAGLRPGEMYCQSGRLAWKETPDAPASLENFGLLFMRLLGPPLEKGGVRLEQQSGIPREMPD